MHDVNVIYECIKCNLKLYICQTADIVYYGLNKICTTHAIVD